MRASRKPAALRDEFTRRRRNGSTFRSPRSKSSNGAVHDSSADRCRRRLLSHELFSSSAALVFKSITRMQAAVG
jgi:hypothetical protein